jgi:hypothetical protein
MNTEKLQASVALLNQGLQAQGYTIQYELLHYPMGTPVWVGQDMQLVTFTHDAYALHCVDTHTISSVYTAEEMDKHMQPALIRFAQKAEA